MALWIHNITPSGIPDDQEHTYDVKINNRTLCTFKHVRNHGAVECLRKAADELEKHEALVASLHE